MRAWPADSVDLVVTSPPYWGLRDYGEETVRIWGGLPGCEHEWGPLERGKRKDVLPLDKTAAKRIGFGEGTHDNAYIQGGNFCVKCSAWRGSLGLEPHPQLFIDHLVEICREIKRVLKPTGTFWLNLGDTYCGSGGKGGQYKKFMPKKGQPAHYKQRIDLKLPARLRSDESTGFKPDKKGWLQPKQKLMIPSRVAIALQHEGWILRSDIIWHKPNAMPSSVKDRLTNAYEHVFMFAKQRRYYFDLDAIRVPHAYPETFGKRPDRGKTGEGLYTMEAGKRSGHPSGKNPGDIWEGSKFSLDDGYRQGMNRDESAFSVQLKNPPNPEELVNYLRKWKETHSYKEIDKTLGYDGDCASHWFTFPSSKHGFSYPSPKDWLRLKAILGFDSTFDVAMTETMLISQQIQANPKGRNPGDLWRIPTRPFKGAHFAVFPSALIEPIVKAGSPRWVCSRCGKPRERIVTSDWREKRTGTWRDAESDGRDMGRLDSHRQANVGGLLQITAPSIRTTVGWSDCGCGEKWVGGIVMDPFGGSGTVGQVARKLGRRFIIIDVVPEYTEMAYQRVRGKYRPLPEGAVKLDQFMEAEE